MEEPSSQFLASAYSGPLARLYDTLHGDDDDQAFWIAQAQACGGSVLELGCGTGRLTLELAANAGVEVYGIDASADMLEILRERLGSQSSAVQERVHLAQDHFDTFELRRQFAMIFFSCDTFQHLIGTDLQLAALKRIKEHLAPGGKLYIDISLPDPQDMLDASGEAQVYEFPEDGNQLWRLTLTPHVDIRQGRQGDSILIERLERDGDRERVLESARTRSEAALLWSRELILLLEHAGFEVKARYADYQGTVFDGSQDQLICVAEAAR